MSLGIRQLFERTDNGGTRAERHELAPVVDEFAADQAAGSIGALTSLHNQFPRLVSPEGLIDPSMSSTMQPSAVHSPHMGALSIAQEVINPPVAPAGSTEVVPDDPNNFFADDDELRYAAAAEVNQSPRLGRTVGSAVPYIGGSVMSPEVSQAEYVAGISNTENPVAPASSAVLGGESQNQNTDPTVLDITAIREQIARMQGAA